VVHHGINLPDHYRPLLLPFHNDFTDQIECPSRSAANQLGDPSGKGMPTVRLTIRTAMVKIERSLLEELLYRDSGHRSARVACDGSHQAEFSYYSEKTIDTVLGAVRWRRAYYPLPSVRPTPHSARTNGRLDRNGLCLNPGATISSGAIPAKRSPRSTLTFENYWPFFDSSNRHKRTRTPAKFISMSGPLA